MRHAPKVFYIMSACLFVISHQLCRQKKETKSIGRCQTTPLFWERGRLYFREKVWPASKYFFIVISLFGACAIVCFGRNTFL